jgi:hypothetical protein
VAEAAVNVVLTVTRSGDLSVPASVQYATCGSACSAIATAIAGSDFTAGSGTVNFAAGVASQTISVALTNDTAVEGNETFTVVLSNPSGASIGNAGSARVTILDGQGGQLTPVGQLYNITSPDNADESFLRFYNLGSASIPVVGTLYDQDGAILGTADLALTAGLRGKGVLVLGSADIAALFGVASWSGRAWMEVKSTVNGSTLLMQNLVRSTTLTNMSCVSDRFAVNIPAGGNTDQAFVRLYNTGSSAGTVRATLHDQDGNVLGSPNSILLASLDAKAVSVLTADMIQAATGAPAWSGRAWLDISADFGSSLKIMNLIRDPSNTLNDMSCVFPLNSVGQLYNIAAPDNADSAYLRFYNSGTSAGTVSATLYDQNGVVLGTQGRVLTANLPANGVLALASADIANQFGVATWSGRAWMEVTTSLPDGSLLMQNLVRSSTLTNMTCVSDRVAVNIPAGGNTDQAFVRLYNVGSSGGAVRGTLYDQDGNILGGANSILLPSLAGKAVAVLTADMIQAATGASGWGGRAWLDLSADFGSNLKIMNLIRDPSNTLNDMSCAFD